MNLVWHGIAVALIFIGLCGAIVPAVPGIPLIYVGLWSIAALDGFHHLGLGWLVGIAMVGSVGLILDLGAAALGAKRVGASRRAVAGALLGSFVGVFFGLPGLLLGPFLGALIGELSAGNSVMRSAHVGVGAWLGLLFGTLMKMVSSVSMLALFAAAWWWNKS